MPGFFISNKQSGITLKDKFPDRCVKGFLEILGNGVALRQTLDKFLLDKAFDETDKIVVIIEGYLLNKAELFDLYKETSMLNLVEKMLEECGEDFFKHFRGNFSGAVFVKSSKKWIVFTNQIGDNPIFYVYEQGKFAAGSQVQYVLDFCREQDVRLTVNEDCAYQMLTYGFMTGDDTYVSQIKRLHGGDYIVLTEQGIQIKSYHRFASHPERLLGKTEEEIIDMVDDFFRKAVDLEWKKDDEYGYQYLADISGGLDSRMNLWVAHELKERHVLLLTYSKKGELDEEIAAQIAAYWNDEWVFKPLDDISFMGDVDENTELLAGLSLYAGITGGKRFLECLNLTRYGIEHTGMVGDATLGSFYSSRRRLYKKMPTGRYSEKLANKIPAKVLEREKEYDSHETYLLYTRGFRGACNSHLIRRNYTEVGSPFLNTDFLQLCLDIPTELRINHNIYKKWILAKYPQAANFRWEKTGGKITENKYWLALRTVMKKGPAKFLKTLGFEMVARHGMNPLDYWLKNNSKIQSYLDTYEKNAIEHYESFISNSLADDIDLMYREGNASEKAMALTVLSALKLYLT